MTPLGYGKPKTKCHPIKNNKNDLKFFVFFKEKKNIIDLLPLKQQWLTISKPL